MGFFGSDEDESNLVAKADAAAQGPGVLSHAADRMGEDFNNDPLGQALKKYGPKVGQWLSSLQANPEPGSRLAPGVQNAPLPVAGPLAQNDDPTSPDGPMSDSNDPQFAGYHPLDLMSKPAPASAKGELMSTVSSTDPVTDLIGQLTKPKDVEDEVMTKNTAGFDTEDDGESDEEPDSKGRAPASDDGDGKRKPINIDVGKKGKFTQEALRDAQQREAGAELSANLGKAANTIGSGIARLPVDQNAQKSFDELAKSAGSITQNFKDQMAMEKYDPSSPSSQAFRQYLKGLGVNVSDGVSAADGEKLYPMIFKGFELDETRKAHTADIKYRTAALGEQRRAHDEMMRYQKDQDKLAKQEASDDKSFERLAKTANEDMSQGRTPFGRNAGIVRSANALKALVGNTPMKDWTELQINDFAKNMDAMLSNGAGTVSGMKNFVPHSWVGDVRKFGSKALNRPLGMNQPEFAKMLMDMVNREAAVARQGVQQTKSDFLRGYEHLAQRHPERWNREFGDILDADSVVSGSHSKRNPQQNLSNGGNGGGGSARQVVKAGYNPKTDQTQIIYSDGSKEVKQGKVDPYGNG
jgi:hypothetical protein